MPESNSRKGLVTLRDFLSLDASIGIVPPKEDKTIVYPGLSSDTCGKGKDISCCLTRSANRITHLTSMLVVFLSNLVEDALQADARNSKPTDNISGEMIGAYK